MSSNLSRCAKVISHYAFITVSSLSKKNIFQKCYFGEVAKMQERQIRMYVESLSHFHIFFRLFCFRIQILSLKNGVYLSDCISTSMQFLAVIIGIFPGLHLSKCLKSEKKKRRSQDSQTRRAKYAVAQNHIPRTCSSCQAIQCNQLVLFKRNWLSPDNAVITEANGFQHYAAPILPHLEDFGSDCVPISIGNFLNTAIRSSGRFSRSGGGNLGI